jgi:phosphate/sulfate permease
MRLHALRHRLLALGRSPTSRGEVWVIYVLVLALFVLGYVELVHRNREQARSQITFRTFRVGQLRSCHRLNVLRAESNRSQLRDYQLFTATITLIEAAATASPAASSNQHAQTMGYLTKIRDDALGKEWTPLTKCIPATDHPASYIPPSPVAFSRQGPPASALQVGAGE